MNEIEYVKDLKPGAIWARVSTHDQHETSLPSQVERCRQKLTELGYTVVHTLEADWSSMDLISCPKFQELLQLVRSRVVEAVAVLDRDRLEAHGLQRLVFLSECRDAGVELIICQGPPILDGPEGQIVELALAIGKERSVLRARTGSADGLRDRVVMRHKPPTYRNPYGYQWDKGTNYLVPDYNWENVKLIFDLALGGATYGAIIDELKTRGINSPSGQPIWNKTGLSYILHNPVYAGRYHALKAKAVAPKKRRGKTSGNSSCKRLVLDETVYVREIQIIEPPITWEQRLQILDQLDKHQKLSQRNAKRDYLLRGFIRCMEHIGKKGEPRIFHGRPHYNSYCYVCPVGGCRVAYLDGPATDESAKLFTRILLSMKGKQLRQFLDSQSGHTEKSLSNELRSLELKQEKLIDRQVKLEDGFISEQIPPEVHSRLLDKYRAEREWIEENKRLTLNQLAQIKDVNSAIDNVEELYKKLQHKLHDLSNTEWRKVLETLDYRLLVNLNTPVLKTTPENLRRKLHTDGQYANVSEGSLKNMVYNIGFNIPELG